MPGPVPAHGFVAAVSVAACSGQPTWKSSTNLLRRQLERRFGAAVSVEYVELFSPRGLELPGILDRIGDESLRLPIVLLNGEVLSSGEKLNEGLIARQVAALLPPAGPARPT